MTIFFKLPPNSGHLSIHKPVIKKDTACVAVTRQVLLLWCAILISRHNIMARDWREIEYIGKKSNRVRNNDIELRKNLLCFHTYRTHF